MTTIKVDKERPIKFGLYAFKKFAELEGKTLDDVLNNLGNLNWEQNVRLIYCGFFYGAKYFAKELDFTEENVWFWLDDNPNLMNELGLILQGSMPRGNPETPQTEG